MKHIEMRRCEMLGQYMIDNKSTVRDTAKRFGVSKSTVHKDVTARLKLCNNVLYDQVREILDENKSERHLRGGEATKNKYKLKAELKNARA